MKFVRWVLTIVIVAAAIAFVLLAYFGAFGQLEVKVRSTGPYTYVYEKFTGDYKNSGKAFNQVYAALKAEDINSTLSIGIYYDNPKIVPSDKLRSDCGSIISAKDISKLSKLNGQFKIGKMKKQMSMVAEFPIKSTFSYIIGPMKGYSALAKYSSKKGYKWGQPFEVYDMKAGKVFYVMAVQKK